MWIQTGVTVLKLSGVMTFVTLTFDFWPWPFAWTSCLSMILTLENFRKIQWEEHCQKDVTDGRTDRQTDWTIHRAAWSQLKNDLGDFFDGSQISDPQHLNTCCGFVHTGRRTSELGISMRAEGSKNISQWFSRFISDSITLDMLLENDGNFGEVINGTDIRPDSTHLS